LASVDCIASMVNLPVLRAGRRKSAVAKLDLRERLPARRLPGFHHCAVEAVARTGRFSGAPLLYLPAVVSPAQP